MPRVAVSYTEGQGFLSIEGGSPGHKYSVTLPLDDIPAMTDALKSIRYTKAKEGTEGSSKNGLGYD